LPGRQSWRQPSGKIQADCVCQPARAFDGTGDPFNSEKYRRARRFFSSGAPGSGLYCERCEWDQTAVSTGSLQIRQYFRAMDAAFFDRKSLRILSGW
jgi:hypothetical protein